MNPVRPQPSWPLSALLLTALALAGCGDTITHESKIRVDVSACLVPSAAGGGGAACGSALQQQAQAGLTACLAYRIGTMDQAALPLVLTEGTLRPTRAEAFEVAGATRVAMRLFLLKPGNDATACAGYTLETACRPADATSPASCLLAFRAESTAVSGDGRVDIVYGSGEVPCGIECNDLCQPNDSTCQKLCWGAGEPLVELCNGADDDCDGEVDEGFGVGEACTGAGECGAGLRECACHATAGCDPADLTDARWTQALCTTAPGGSASLSQAEQCNGLDDDCDGQIDEEWPSLGQSCTSAGVCGTGLFMCAQSQDKVCCSSDPACTGSTPALEVCNGLDDDCDGTLDEEVTPPAALSCPRFGVCAGYAPACRGAQGWVCQYPELIYEAVERSCDGKDNDCDSQVDEELAPPLADRQVGVCQGARKVCGGVTGWQEPDYAQQPNYQAIEELCDGLDNDCDGAVDEDCDCLPSEERECGSDVGECQLGKQLCSPEGTWGDCEGGVLEQPEVCNGKDDDCDGTADDGNPEGGIRCGSKIGECRQGIVMCVEGELVCDGETGPSPEICDNRDNDCDGTIDEDAAGSGAECGSDVGECSPGAKVCEFGLWACANEVGPVPEICNGLDDDCDGTADDGNPGGGVLCGSKIGECRQGLLQCSGGKLACVDAVGPADEICDGRDNDCDGKIDDEVPGFGVPCGSDVGACTPGVRTCEQGQDVCRGGTQPSTEICNGLDDDCDTFVDEDLLAPPANLRVGVCVGQVKVCAGVGLWQEPDYTKILNYHATEDSCDDQADNNCNGSVNEGCTCNQGDTQACGLSTGECEPGTQTCDDQGQWGPCLNATGPTDELCNGLDDDCDNEVDEDFTLGASCTGPGGVGSPCGPGKWECDLLHVGRICSTAPGASQDASLPETCNGLDDDCDGEADDDFQLGQACPGVGGLGTPCTEGVWECNLATGARRCSTHPGSSQDRSELETCNGFDDDCDTFLDEDYALSTLCTGVGTCGAGVWECDPGTLDRRCSSDPGGSQDGSLVETCNGLDDDCDGQVDEDFLLGTGCTGTGQCGPGLWECDPATLDRRCSSDPGGSTDQSQPEGCDGLDNDCNGLDDDGLPTETCGEGICLLNEQSTCNAGVAVPCDPFFGATDEVPDNGLDDDCDGTTDEATCPVGWTLYEGTGHCYLYESTTRKGDDARNRCVALGGKLVSIGDAAEEAFVDDLRGGFVRVWIGLRRDYVDRRWTNWYWVDNEPVSYLHWGQDEPENSGCTRMAEGSTVWEARDCNSNQRKYAIVCERLPGA
ncbi:MAG: C-type lectin domain-containing protein [Myxococcota bacterium]|jgi:hypothetical protein|nr:C-type lectin domain-containing protein [Myxococcota bacterium]